MDFDVITVLGGEPMLNPTLPQWLQGLRNLWPDSEIRLVTNGTRLDYWPDFYDILREFRIILEVTSHNRSRHPQLLSELTQFLQGNIQRRWSGDLSKWTQAYQAVRDPSWPDCDDINKFASLPAHIQQECRDVHGIDPEHYQQETCHLQMTDDNGVTAWLFYAEHFYTAPLRYRGDDWFEVYHSDPIKAHGVCYSKYCHTFVCGRLYKCHHVALLPEFRKQYQVDMSERDINLLESYCALTVHDDDDEFESFISKLKHHMPQCSLCPSNLDIFELHSSTNKPRVKKIPIRVT